MNLGNTSINFVIWSPNKIHYYWEHVIISSIFDKIIRNTSFSSIEFDIIKNNQRKLT